LLLPEDSEYRMCARRLQDAIVRSGGVTRAADIAEQLMLQ